MSADIEGKQSKCTMAKKEMRGENNSHKNKGSKVSF